MPVWTTAHEPNFERYQSGCLQNGQPGNNPATLVPFDAPYTLASTPPANVKPVVKPQKIIVQSHPDNTGAVLVGQNSPLADDGSNGGHFLAPGEMFVLPDNDTAKWFFRGSGLGGQKLMYTYYSGAN